MHAANSEAELVQAARIPVHQHLHSVQQTACPRALIGRAQHELGQTLVLRHYLHFGRHQVRGLSVHPARALLHLDWREPSPDKLRPHLENSRQNWANWAIWVAIVAAERWGLARCLRRW